MDSELPSIGVAGYDLCGWSAEKSVGYELVTEAGAKEVDSRMVVVYFWSSLAHIRF